MDCKTENQLYIDLTESSDCGKRNKLDLIRRQDAIDAIHCDITVTGRQNAELVAATIGTFADRIKALPSAQPDVPDINVGDMISRQNLMEKLNGLCDKMCPYMGQKYRLMLVEES